MDINISTEGMQFSSKSVIYASFGSNTNEKLCNTMVDGYHGAWNEMEKRLMRESHPMQGMHNLNQI